MQVRESKSDLYDGLPPLFSKRKDFWTIPKQNIETIYILGGGASFQEVSPDLLKDKFVIGCNEAFRLGADYVDWCHFTDLRWWIDHEEELKTYEGTITTAHQFVYDPRIHILNSKPSGIEFKNRSRVGMNRNTGLAAINIAIHLGATKIILLGFDMEENAEAHHWYERKDKGSKHPTYRMHRKYALEVWEDIRRHGGIEIINACKTSSIPFWPKEDIKDLLI